MRSAGTKRSRRRRGGRRAPLSVVVAVSVLLVAPGCGAAGDAAQTAVDLRIVVAASADPGAPQRSWRLRCRPQGGNWPRRRRACASLTAAHLAPIGPETRDLVPIARQPLRVEGRAFGRRVSLFFGPKGSSTRRERFHQLSRALGLPDSVRFGRRVR